MFLDRKHNNKTGLKNTEMNLMYRKSRSSVGILHGQGPDSFLSYSLASFWSDSYILRVFSYRIT